MHQNEDKCLRNYCAAIIQATYKMSLTRRLFKYHRFAMYHIAAIQKLAPQLSFDFVVADSSIVLDPHAGKLLSDKVSTQGGELIVQDLRLEASGNHHDTKKLTSLFAHIAVKTLVG